MISCARLCMILFTNTAKAESALYKFFNKELYALFPYHDLKKARKSAANITKAMQTIPKAESPYLRGLMANLHSYKGSSIDQMMTGFDLQNL